MRSTQPREPLLRCFFFLPFFPCAASRQTYTQENNKNNEGKQHRNKT
jgi:hypothetical protein